VPEGTRPVDGAVRLDLDAGLRRLGYADFRPGQREAIGQLLAVGRLLLVAPTGGGKSLVYQLPAVLLGGTTLVVSPLISLMQDQVRALASRGIAATYLALLQQLRGDPAVFHAQAKQALELATEFRVLSLEQLVAAQSVEGAMLGRSHEPGAGVVRNARLRPLLERDHERVLRQLFGHAHVADDPGQAGDQPRRFDPEDRLDGTLGLGNRHGYRSHHRHLPGARRASLALGCRPEPSSNTPARTP